MGAKRALIAGISGQDGQILSEFLLKKGYQVWGVVRTLPASPPTEITWLKGDVGASQDIEKALEQAQPDEVYNLAAISRVMESYKKPQETIRINALSPVLWLDAIRRLVPGCRFFQAGSSEMFGRALETPQTETTPFNPRNPYGAAKAHAHWLVRSYREEYGIFACNGILFNHESERRPVAFVTRKITAAAAAIKSGKASSLVLGDLEARRDWSHAADFVRAMWGMLQQENAEDYVLASGKTRSVADFCHTAFARVDLDWRQYVKVDPELVRRENGMELCGDIAKAKGMLGWRPLIDFEALVARMVDADLDRPYSA
jgi:GDPmannose 4,6-dehydratase